MAAWLGRQRKLELVTLAERAGIDDVDGLRKDELAALLDEHLQKNASRLHSDATFKEYYGRTSSPTKRSSDAATADHVVSEGEPKPARKRRVTKVKQETDLSEGPSASSPGGPSAAASTPAATRHLTSPRPAGTAHISTFPPSPAVVTDAIETQTRRFSAVANDVLTASHVENHLVQFRELVSSIVGVQTLTLLLEGYYLQRRLIPWRYAFNLPASRIAGSGNHAIYLPDFFVLLTDIYWATTLLWAFSQIWVPLAASWLCNLTIRPVLKHGISVAKPRMTFDPLIFSIVRGLISWLIFSRGSLIFGLFSAQTVRLFGESMPAGYTGLLISSAIGALASLYDAAQRK